MSNVHLFVYDQMHIQHEQNMCMCPPCVYILGEAEWWQGSGGSEWQLSAGKTNRLRAAKRARSPGTLRNIVSTALPGSTADTAPGAASLRSQITASEPRQGGERPEGQGCAGNRCFRSDSKQTVTSSQVSFKSGLPVFQVFAHHFLTK